MLLIMLVRLTANCDPLCRYRVLDEVDRMMAMGFIEDVETILKAEEGHQVGRGGNGRGVGLQQDWWQCGRGCRKDMWVILKAKEGRLVLRAGGKSSSGWGQQ